MSKNPAASANNSQVFSEAQLRAAIQKIESRIAELEELDFNCLMKINSNNLLIKYEQKTNATLRAIFGNDSVDYRENEISIQLKFTVFYPGMDSSVAGNVDKVVSKIETAKAKLTALVEIFREQLNGTSEALTDRLLRSYEGLDLHPEVSRAASKLYKDGHYAHAVEQSVKALNGLVRLRSKLDFDGTTLMERAFSPGNPILRFNDLSSQSDKDEQKGFMMLFSGAVSGLRNPRAHSFVEDDPERALEFIAFVSLLAKLLDETTSNV